MENQESNVTSETTPQDTPRDPATGGKEAIELPYSVQRWVDFMFVPAQANYRNILWKPWFVISVSLLLLFVVLSIPPVQTYLWNSALLDYQASARANREIWKLYLDSASVILEVLIAICLGGAVLGNPYTDTVKGIITGAEEKITDRYRRHVEGIREDTRRDAAQVDDVIRDIIREFTTDHRRALLRLKKYLRLYCMYSFKLYRKAFTDIPVLYRNLLIATILTTFPGGLPALLAFIGFILRMATKVASLYLSNLALIP